MWRFSIMVTNSEKICHILGQSGFWLNPETFVLQYIQSACKSTRQNYVHLFSMRQAHSLKSMVSQGKATYTQVCLRMMPQLLPSLCLVVKEIVRLYEQHWAKHIVFSHSSDLFCSIKYNVYSYRTCFLHLKMNVYISFVNSFCIDNW